MRYQTDEYDQALDWLGKAIELSPESKNTRFAYGMMADIYVMQEQRTEAIETYNKLLPLAPDSTSEIQYRHALVSLFVEDGEYESALEHARRWAELDPDNPEVRDTVAKLALSTGSEDEALAEMERVVEMTPGDFATIERLADIYRRRGSTSKAFSAYEKLHGNDPTNFLFLDQMLTLGRQLGKSKRIQVRLLKKMLALQPQNLGVIEQLADESGSISMVERGLKLDRRNGKLLYMKGDYFYRKWKDKGARQDSVNALNWFRKAHKDPQWAGNAKRMIDELDPPITEEERKLREFFKKKSTKDEADVSGKK